MPEYTPATSTQLQPLIWCVIWILTCWIIVSFPHRLDRWASISLLFTAGYGAFKTSADLSPDDTLNEIYTRFILIGGSHILHLTCKSKGRNGGLREMDHIDAQPCWSPWYRGYKLVFNCRGVATPWEAPYLWRGVKHTWEADRGLDRPARSSASQIARLNPSATAAKQDQCSESSSPQTTIPSDAHKSQPPRLFKQGRWAAVATRIAYFVLNFILLSCAYEFLNPSTLFDIVPNPSTDYTREKEGILRRFILQFFFPHSKYTLLTAPTPVTTREIKLRIFLALEYVVGDYLLLSLYTDFFAILWLSLGIDEPWEFPPFFGDITEAYTMRRFWNMFWHRVIYRSFNAHAALISRYVLRMRQRTPVTRVINGLLVFGISAVMHAMVSARFGNSCAWGRSMLYWMWQPMAFVLEDTVQAGWRRGLRSKVRRVLGESGVRVLGRGVGYLWVVSWMVWEAPKRTFALATCKT
ncbi:unnamed protein product [Periconia digitata]|uniref:Wax synthase domain-containing protein n=1 Tax=Periconia digitata TaxID=1303443 RepID=A0A9W4UIE9_9PLEO|nr:unnamed protein product [Periconia digitata]